MAMHTVILMAPSELGLERWKENQVTPKQPPAPDKRNQQQPRRSQEIPDWRLRNMVTVCPVLQNFSEFPSKHSSPEAPKYQTILKSINSLEYCTL